MTTIQYSNLNPQKREIRLLTLHPRKNPSPTAPSTNLMGNEISGHSNFIHSSLKTLSIDDEPSYVALSYTWGPAKPSATIHVDNQIITVGKNLEAALRHIQQSDQPVTLWIDAICINQSDKAEKSHQIAMMCEIYTKAAETLVWLGLSKDDSDTAMKEYQRIGEKALNADIGDFRASDIAQWSETGGDERISRIKGPLNELAAKEDLDVFHASMIPFSKREYWTRVWVLQEISVARNATIVCGSRRLSFNTFAAASNFCAFARWRLNTRYTLKHYQDKVIRERLRSVSGSENAPSAAPNVLIGARRRYHLETGERETLGSLLKRTCILRPAGIPLQATEAVDKIYGLLGLASDSKKLSILPDCSKSIQEVYTDVARALIVDEQTTILAWCQQPKSVGHLPSWVPDFSAPIREPCGEDHQAGALFSAAGNTKVSITALQSGDKRCLGLLGTRVDIVAELGSAFEPTVETIFIQEGAQRLLNEVEEFCTQSSLLLAQEQASDAKMRIPCADQAGYGASRWRPFNTIREEYELLRLPETYTSQTTPSRHYRVAMGFQHDRKPFLSAEGYVGLAPSSAEPGDIIVLIFGATVPFVLRELDSGKMELVGEAYVYGIMDGEFLNVDRPPETFCLY